VTTLSRSANDVPVAGEKGLRIKLFLDGANLEQMKSAYNARQVQGFTTNPTLMRKAGISDYAGFAREVLAAIPDLPVSFEVCSDEFADMEREARIIASWRGLAYAKIPISNTRGELSTPVVRRLSGEGLKLNVTAVFTLDQVRAVADALSVHTPAVVSIFAGRIADTGVDPVPIIYQAVDILRDRPLAEVLWASPREALNIIHAQSAGCHIITATGDLVAKMNLFHKNLTQYSLETVRMFHDDARASGLSIL
jgi:transaldolase